MQTLEVYSEASREVIDEITLSGDVISYSTGSAEGLFQAKKALYITNRRTFSALSGSSNGYISFRLAE